MIKCIKGKMFQWMNSSQHRFETLKKKMKKSPVLALLDLNKVFEVECNALGVRIGVVLR